MTKGKSPITPIRLAKSRILRRCLGAYLSQSRRVWNHLPASLRGCSVGRAYGRHLHALVRLHADRRQSFGTFFLRNRAELELLRLLLDQKVHGSNVNISVLACSKGAEVYSILWAIHSARPDLRLTVHALDISHEILEFAQRGVYLRNDADVVKAPHAQDVAQTGDVNWNTQRDQIASIFERMTDAEAKAMFDIEGDHARVRSSLRVGIIWLRGNAEDPQLVGALGPQDIVVANRFLCHMQPQAADRCLRNIVQLVKPGGYLFVSGIDLDVRTRVAREMGWRPIANLMREIHEGDASLRNGWPLEYWGLEPFCADRPDWRIRYASVFQIGESPDSGSATMHNGAQIQPLEFSKCAGTGCAQGLLGSNQGD